MRRWLLVALFSFGLYAMHSGFGATACLMGAGGDVMLAGHEVSTQTSDHHTPAPAAHSSDQVLMAQHTAHSRLPGSSSIAGVTLLVLVLRIALGYVRRAHRPVQRSTTRGPPRLFELTPAYELSVLHI